MKTLAPTAPDAPLTPAERIHAANDRIMQMPTLVAYGLLAGLLITMETAAAFGQCSAEQVAEDIERAVAVAESRVGRVFQ